MLLGFALLAFPLLPRAGGEEGRGPGKGVGTVTFLAGEATRTRSAPEALAVGAPVFEGDLLETRRRTRLEVRLGDGSVLRLGPSSRALVQTASFGKTVEAREVSAKLLVGQVWAKVAKAIGGEGRFEIRTENAVAGVRGTAFRVDAAADRSVVVRVYSGAVAVASPAGSAAGREAGEGARPAAPGAKPGRREIPGPREVTRAQWERIVTGMMEVRVSAEGVPGEPTAFALAGAGQDAWEDWNRERDAIAGERAPTER